MLKSERKHLPQSQDDVCYLYQKYSAALLGYIRATVPDQEESEAHLITILSRFAVDYREDVLKGQVTWVKLLCYSRTMLPQLQYSDQQLGSIQVDVPSEQYEGYVGLDLLEGTEKEIFYSIYYRGKSIGDLAKAMGESESEIRRQFKSSFDKIRSARGN